MCDIANRAPFMDQDLNYKMNNNLSWVKALYDQILHVGDLENLVKMSKLAKTRNEVCN